MGDNRRILVVPLVISVLLHLLVLLGLSVNFLWPKSVSAKKSVPIRIVSVDQPKPKEKLPLNPESRFLSNANRKESGKGKPADKPRLKRALEDKIPGRRGEQAPEVASLVPPSPPTPARPPVPEAREVTPVQKSEPEKPKTEKKPEAKKKPEPEKKTLPDPEKTAVRTPPKPEPPRNPPLLKEVKKARPTPPESEAVKTNLVKPRPPRKKTPEPNKKAARPEKKKPKKRVKVASLPKPKPKPKEARKPVKKKAAQKPKAPTDPIAMFRPKSKGRPDAPRFKLSDEDADRITKAAEDERRREEEAAGDEISLDTKDYRFVSYFAHIKKRIYENWRWPEEARRFSGRLKLRFVIRPDGSLSRVDLTDSSGYKILDDEALSAIAKAAPFKPFPPELKNKPLAIKGSFSYQNSPGIFRR